MSQEGTSLYRVGVVGNQMTDIIILGMNWMQNKKITYHLRTSTIKVYSDYNCTYTPLPRTESVTLSEHI